MCEVSMESYLGLKLIVSRIGDYRRIADYRSLRFLRNRYILRYRADPLCYRWIPQAILTKSGDKKKKQFIVVGVAAR